MRNRSLSSWFCLLGAVALFGCSSFGPNRTAERNPPKEFPAGTVPCPGGAYIVPGVAKYPKVARDAGYINGWVIIRQDIVSGATANVGVFDSSPSLFEPEALKSAKEMQYPNYLNVSNCLVLFQYRLV